MEKKPCNEFPRRKLKSGDYVHRKICKKCTAARLREQRKGYSTERKAKIREAQNRYRNTNGRKIVLEGKKRYRRRKLWRLYEATGVGKGVMFHKHDSHVKCWRKQNKPGRYVMHKSHVDLWKRVRRDIDHVKDLNRKYIVHLLTKDGSLSRNNVTEEMVEVKRQLVMLNREIRRLA